MLNLNRICESKKLSVKTSRRTISQIINESWSLYYDIEKDDRLKKLIETHLQDIKSNPTRLEKLSKNLSILQSLYLESTSGRKLSEADLADTSGLDKSIENDLGDLKKESDSQDVSDGEAEANRDKSGSLMTEDEDLDDDRLDVQDATIDQCKMVNTTDTDTGDFDAPKADPEEVKKFAENSRGKIFRRVLSKPENFRESVKTFNLQESITAYKAANSAMTQLAIEYEHNQGFKETFNVLSTVLGKATKSILESIKKSEPLKTEALSTLRRFNKALDEDNQEEIEDFVDWVDNEYKDASDTEEGTSEDTEEGEGIDLDLPDTIESEEQAVEVIQQIIDAVYPDSVDIDVEADEDENGVPDEMEDITPEESEDLKKYLCLLRGCEEGSEEANEEPTEDEVTAMEEHLMIRRKKIKESQSKHLNKKVKESTTKGRRLKKRG